MALEKIQLDVQYSVYHGVKGKAIINRDIDQWEIKRFYDFIEFAQYFIEDPYGEGKVKTHVTKAKLKILEKKVLPVDYHPFQEFMYRINVFTTDPDFEEVTFMRKFNMMKMRVLKYLKEKPHIVDDKIREMVQGNPQLDWCLNLVKIEENRVGQEMIVSDHKDAEGVKVTNLTPDMIMMQSLARISSLMNEISGSFTQAEIKKMKTSEKFAAISKLSFVYNVGRNMKPNANIFKQINIINAKPEDLEKTLLENATGNND